MPVTLEQQLDRYAAGAGHKPVSRILEEANLPPKSAKIIIMVPRWHSLYPIAVRD